MGEATIARLKGDEAALAEAQADIAERGRRMLKRRHEDVDAEDAPVIKKPKKLNRIKSMQWAVCVDNILRQSMGVGLDHFRISEERKKTSALSWPSLSIAPDQNGDGLCASHIFQFAKDKYVLDRTDDPSHGAWNDLKLACGDSNLMSHVMCMSIAYNSRFGPYNTGGRQVELNDAFHEWHANVDCNDALFLDALPGLLEEVGESDRIGEDDIAEALLLSACVACLVRIAARAAIRTNSGHDRC